MNLSDVERAVAAATERAKTSPVKVIRCSMFGRLVCAPATFTAKAVEKETNLIDVCGTQAGWMVDRKISPVTCAKDATRNHWVLVC